MKVGLQVVVDDIAESMKGVTDEVVESVLENTVMEMARDMACEVCFENGCSRCLGVPTPRVDLMSIFYRCNVCCCICCKLGVLL